MIGGDKEADTECSRLGLIVDYKKRREDSHAKDMAYESPWIYQESCSSCVILNCSSLLSGH